MYETHARDTVFYADGSVLPPSVPRKTTPVAAALDVCFGWQADYWLVEDVLSALVQANDTFDTEGVGGNVLDGVVKRVESIGFTPFIPAAAPGAAPLDGRAGRGGRAGAGRGVRGGRAGGGFVPGPAFTGRGDSESELYDVRVARVTLIASYEKLPALINAISSYNFMTVLDADIYAVDQWDQIENGYYAGSDFAVRVELEIETLWLRSWTKRFMPASVRERLGIPADEPVDGSGEGPL